MLVCDKCGAGITTGAKFCAQCGDPVTEADKVTNAVSDNGIAQVEIKFGQSSSPSYKKAVSICENLPSYKVSGEGKEIEHSVTLPITEIELLINLYELVGNWKSSQMLINGHIETKKALTYYGAGCYRNRQKSFRPEQYCFGEREYEANIWGCKRLNMPVHEWGGGWLDYGKFDSNGIWHFDKARIRHELETKIKENELCPVLKRQHVFETLENLPEIINPKREKNWEYRTSYEQVDGEFKEVAVGIRPVLDKVNRYVVGEYKPYWEREDPGSSDSNVKTIDIEIDDRRQERTRNRTSGKRKEGGSLTWIWVLVAIVVVLYLVGG